MKDVDARASLIWAGFFASILIVSVMEAALLAVYQVAAGKPAPPGAAVGIATSGLFLAFSALRTPRTEAVAEPHAIELQEQVNKLLVQSGSRKVSIQIANRGVLANNPRPSCSLSVTTISRRLIDRLSPRALRWLVSTETLASARFNRRTLVPGLGLILGILVLVALAEGRRISDQTAQIIFGVGILLFVPLILFSGKAVFASDKELTQSSEDREAAREALSFIYFAQADLSKWEKPFARNTLAERRANRLGISLEQGFRIKDEPEQS